MKRFDVVILGGGAGAKLIWGALPGQSVAVVEENLVGGDCPFVACIPSKAMLRSAEIWNLAADPEHGSMFTGRLDASAAWVEACRRRDAIVQHRDDTANAAALQKAGAVLIRGTGAIDGPGIVAVNGEKVAYRDLVVNTGSRPRRLATLPTDSPHVWTSGQALSSPELPDSMMVVGGGPVGVELAFLYATFGCRVTLVHRGQRLLPAEEPEVGDAVRMVLEDVGVEVRLAAEVAAAVPAEAGLKVTLAGQEVIVSKVLVAVGREPRTGGIGLENLHLPDTQRGGIAVDEQCRVLGERHVWAIGDVVGISPFTHTSHYQGRVVARNLNGLPTTADYRTVPRTVYIQPAIAASGHTRASAAAAGIEPVMVTSQIRATVRARTDGSPQGWLAVLADPKTRRLIGATAMGGHCEEWIAALGLVIRTGIDIDLAADVVRPFPTFSEVAEDCLWQLRDVLRSRDQGATVTAGLT